MPTPLIRLTCVICSSIERMELQGPHKLWADVAKSQPSTDRNNASVGACSVVCPNCTAPFGVVITRGNGSASWVGIFGSNDPNATDAALKGAKIVTVPADPLGVDRFEHVPPIIAETFVFVQEDAQRRRNAAGIMSGARSCLDVALKHLGEIEGGRRDRINNLAAKGIITAAIAAWSQNLWQEGSDASHDLQADMPRALEHVAFLKLFFEVAFELPAKIALNPHAPADVAPVPVPTA
jgi:hypothetical protein